MRIARNKQKHNTIVTCSIWESHSFGRIWESLCCGRCSPGFTTRISRWVLVASRAFQVKSSECDWNGNYSVGGWLETWLKPMKSSNLGVNFRLPMIKTGSSRCCDLRSSWAILYCTLHGVYGVIVGNLAVFSGLKYWVFMGYGWYGDVWWCLSYKTASNDWENLSKNYEMYAVAISAGWGSIHVMLHLGLGHGSLWVFAWLHYIKIQKSDWSPRLSSFLSLGYSCWGPYQALLLDPSTHKISHAKRDQWC